MTGSTTYYQAALWKAKFDPKHGPGEYSAMIDAVHTLIEEQKAVAYDKAIEDAIRSINRMKRPTMIICDLKLLDSVIEQIRDLKGTCQWQGDL